MGSAASIQQHHTSLPSYIHELRALHTAIQAEESNSASTALAAATATERFIDELHEEEVPLVLHDIAAIQTFLDQLRNKLELRLEENKNNNHHKEQEKQNQERETENDKVRFGKTGDETEESKLLATDSSNNNNDNKNSLVSAVNERKEVGKREVKGPFAVSVEFLLKFVKDYPQCLTMTTAEVVRDIIIPGTLESKLTFVEDRLLDDPKYYRVMGKTKDKCSFLSHAWLMPFKVLVDIAVSSMRARYTELGYVPPVEDYQHLSFFWIDVFCKNQHIPVPAMDEFEESMRLSQHVILSIWPIEKPIVLERIWCLFEVVTCLNLKGDLVPAMCDDDLQKLKRLNFPVQVENAKASVPADIDMIMGLITNTLGVASMNKLVQKTIETSIQYQIASLDPSCFDGEGLVEMSDHSKKKVKDIRIGDRVLTHAFAPMDTDTCSAVVKLVTIDDISKTANFQMCEVNGLLLTTEHPIWDVLTRSWRKASDIVAPMTTTNMNVVYNFELEQNCGNVIINDVIVMTLGHNYTFDENTDKLYGYGWKTNPKRQLYENQVNE